MHRFTMLAVGHVFSEEVLWQISVGRNCSDWLVVALRHASRSFGWKKRPFGARFPIYSARAVAAARRAPEIASRRRGAAAAGVEPECQRQLEKPSPRG
jgi:hypothetical protein